MYHIAQPSRAVGFTLVFASALFLLTYGTGSAHPGHAEHDSADTASSTLAQAATTTPAPASSAVPVGGDNAAPRPYSVEPLANLTDFDDFVVGPGKFELELAPGQSRTVEIAVSNRMGEAKWFKFEIEDTAGSVDGSSAIRLLGSERGPYTLRDFISVPTMEFLLQHGERARIPVTISLPADAEPGGRYGSLVVSTVTKDANPNPVGETLPSSAIVSRIGTLFFITTPGESNRSGELRSFTTVGGKSFYNSGPVNFGIAYENTGSVHTSPYGEIRINNMFGEEVGYSALTPWFAMPQSLRTREVVWDRELLVGRYTATLFLNRGYDDIVDEASVTFYVLPWKLVLAVFLGLFLLIVSVRFVLNRFEVKRK